ncbi:MAG: PIN domain-containing protein [Deltaproteobacteria bacterium]|nr:PIN domain-containing protein [Deltaproteobacteria bacterium]
MDYLADTVTIIRHFSGAGRIGKEARLVLEGVEKGESHLFLSTVLLVEILYLAEKKRIGINLQDSLSTIGGSKNYSVVDLTSSIVSLAAGIKYPEIFDRLIISTAKYLDVPLITSDRTIMKTGLIKTIWS